MSCRFAACLLVAMVAAAATAEAELVTLATGRVMSVSAVRLEADVAVLVLRGGGEIRCPRALIAAVEPDEVPHPVQEAIVTAGGPVPGRAELPYADVIARLAEQHRVDPALVHAVVRVESAYQANARSRRGAMGLMQLMPATAHQYGVVNPYDPEANLSAGIRHLRSLLDRFALEEAIAAYNAGEEAVRRHRGVPPYPETQAYVLSVLAATRGEHR
ncbi:MAG: lytic transglycosylase domain-containing protein [Acidobacteriota bacterium]